MFSAELKKGSSEMLFLSLLEARASPGYAIGQLHEARTGWNLLPSLCDDILSHATYCEAKYVQRGIEKGQQREAHPLPARGPCPSRLRNRQAYRGALGRAADIRAADPLSDAPPPGESRL